MSGCIVGWKGAAAPHLECGITSCIKGDKGIDELVVECRNWQAGQPRELIEVDVTRAPPGAGANSLTSAGLLSIGTVRIRGRICPAPAGSDVSTSSDTPIITAKPWGEYDWNCCGFTHFQKRQEPLIVRYSVYVTYSILQNCVTSCTICTLDPRKSSYWPFPVVLDILWCYPQCHPYVLGVTCF